MDVARLRQGEQIAAAGAIVLFIVMFFDWFGGDGFGASAWESFKYITSILSITIAITLLVVAFRASARSLGDIPASTLVTLLGALSTILILYRILDPIGEADRKFGLFLGLIAAAAIAVGGYLSMQDEGTSFAEAADQFSGERGAGRSTAPPPPPPPGGTAGGPPPSAPPGGTSGPPPPPGA